MPPAFILSQDQTLRREKHDLTIQVSTVQKTAAPEGPADVLWGRAEARLPHVALRCSVAKETTAPEKGVPHNMPRKTRIASPPREKKGKSPEFFFAGGRGEVKG